MTSETESTAFERAMKRRAAATDKLLGELLDERAREGEVVRPARLVAAMRHGVLNGGKRLRPFLLMESAALFAADKEPALHAAAALELVHCYSLIHDDLPAMDDDDLRRGKPTVHKAFDEATAILAGDSLLTYAFDVISAGTEGLDPTIRVELVTGLARAAGVGGMAGGQALDLEAETVKPDEQGIIRLQAMKTGALIRYACEAGALIGRAVPDDRERLSEFGAAIGLAFQLADDLLDVTAEAGQLGKATHKDEAAGKATLVSIHGVDWTRRQLAGLVEQAEVLLQPFGAEADVLKAAARFIAERQS